MTKKSEKSIEAVSITYEFDLNKVLEAFGIEADEDSAVSVDLDCGVLSIRVENG